MGQGMGNPLDLQESSAAGGSSTVARGDKVTRSRQSNNALSRRKRSAAIQNYVQSLPPEFRKQVAQYYEALDE